MILKNQIRKLPFINVLRSLFSKIIFILGTFSLIFLILIVTYYFSSGMKSRFSPSMVLSEVNQNIFDKYLGFNIYQIDDNFKIISDSFKIKKIAKNNECAEIIRDEKWLHWRLIECPYKKDILFFEYKNNFAIVHIFLIENIKKLNILYTYYTRI